MSPAPLSAALTRREGLLACALLAPAALLAACTSADNEPPSGGSASVAKSRASGDLAADVAAQEQLLIATYDAAIAWLGAEPSEAAALLVDIRDQHVAHRDALGGEPGATASSGRATSSDLGTVIASLLTAEREAARDRIRACVAAEDPELARLLALIGASEAAHVPALREVRP